MAVLITGGLGFIGSNFIENFLKNYNEKIINIDNVTYAGNVSLNKVFKKNKNYEFIKGSINNKRLIKKILLKNQPKIIINFAAETHVDRSISNPYIFVQTNISGTFKLLEESLIYWKKLNKNKKKEFKFIHISTDEVYGSLSFKDKKSKEKDQYLPNSPYSASKASSDHLVRSFYKTYNFPVITTHCSNNYGPGQNKEKLIPKIILNILKGNKIPIYGNGKNIRDWIFVKDHCLAILQIIKKGQIGEVYNIGADKEFSNLEITKIISRKMETKLYKKNINVFKDLITFVKDRPGHDLRYSLNSSKLKRKLKWKPLYSFNKGINLTIDWYIKNYEKEKG